MIHISDLAKRIESFLQTKEEKQFKIFIRINFQIDVYVATPNIVAANNYQKEFIQSLSVDIDGDGMPQSEFDDFYSKHKDYLKISFNIISL